MHAYLKVGPGATEKLVEVRALENADLDVVILVLERRVKVWSRIRTIDLVDFNVDDSRSMNHCLIHVEQEQPLAWLELNFYFAVLCLWEVVRQVRLLQVGHVDEVLHVLQNQVLVLGPRGHCFERLSAFGKYVARFMN